MTYMDMTLFCIVVDCAIFLRISNSGSLGHTLFCIVVDCAIFLQISNSGSIGHTWTWHNPPSHQS